MNEFIEALVYLLVFLIPFLGLTFFRNQLRDMFAPQTRTNVVHTQTMPSLSIKAIQNPFTIVLDHVKSSSNCNYFIN